MKRILLLLTIFLAATVAAQGSESLQDQINAATPGSTLNVEGTFQGPIVINKPLTLVGATVESSGPWGIRVTADDVTIQDATVNGGRDGILALEVNDLHILQTEVTGADGSGIEIRDSNSVKLEENVIRESGVNALRVMGGSDVTVLRNEAIDNFRGIHLRWNDNVEAKFNTITGTNEHGLVVEDATGDVVVKTNTVTDNQFGIWVLRTDNAKLETNTVTGTEQSAFGILWQDTANGESTEDRVATVGRPEDNWGNGIEVRFTSGLTINKATVDSVGSNGIRFASTHNSSILRTDVLDSFRGIHLYDTQDIGLLNFDANTLEEHGIVMEQSQRITDEGTRIGSASKAYWILDSHDIHVKDATVDGADQGFRAERGSNIHFQDAQVKSASHGYWFEALRNAHGDNLRVDEATGNGVTVVNSEDVKLSGKIGPSSRGLHMVGVKDALVDNLDVTDSTGDGMVFERMNGMHVKNSDIKGSNIGIWLRGLELTGVNIIESNLMTDARVAGISLDQDAKNVLIKDNEVRDSYRGVKIIDEGSENNRFEGNNLQYNDYGYWAESGNNEIVGGVITNNEICDFWMLSGTADVDETNFKKGSTAKGINFLDLTNTNGILSACSLSKCVSHEPVWGSEEFPYMDANHNGAYDEGERIVPISDLMAGTFTDSTGADLIVPPGVGDQDGKNHLTWRVAGDLLVGIDLKAKNHMNFEGATVVLSELKSDNGHISIVGSEDVFACGEKWHAKNHLDIRGGNIYADESDFKSSSGHMQMQGALVHGHGADWEVKNHMVIKVDEIHLEESDLKGSNGHLELTGNYIDVDKAKFDFKTQVNFTSQGLLSMEGVDGKKVDQMAFVGQDINAKGADVKADNQIRFSATENLVLTDSKVKVDKGHFQADGTTIFTDGADIEAKNGVYITGEEGEVESESDAPSGEAPTCQGQTATVWVDANGIIRGGPDDGDEYDDKLYGTDGDDVIVGTAGDDEIKGQDGNDLICGLDGDDYLKGGKGDDTIYGGVGDDKLKGEYDDDQLFGGSGDDEIDGGKDDDQCESGEEYDDCETIEGRADDDDGDDDDD